MVKSQYVVSADDKKLLGGAIAGMLAPLDPHSQYRGKDDLAELQNDRAGEYAGIGIVAEMGAGEPVVTGVTEYSPGHLAGVGRAARSSRSAAWRSQTNARRP